MVRLIDQRDSVVQESEDILAIHPDDQDVFTDYLSKHSIEA